MSRRECRATFIIPTVSVCTVWSPLTVVQDRAHWYLRTCVVHVGVLAIDCPQYWLSTLLRVPQGRFKKCGRCCTQEAGGDYIACWSATGQSTAHEDQGPFVFIPLAPCSRRGKHNRDVRWGRQGLHQVVQHDKASTGWLLYDLRLMTDSDVMIRGIKAGLGLDKVLRLPFRS